MISVPWRALLSCLGLAGAALGLVDFALAGHGFEAGDYLAVLALGVLAGAAFALGWGALFSLGGRLKSWWLVACWLSLGLAAGAELAAQLGVYSRLGGRDWKLAFAVLGGSLAVGLGVGALGILHQPRPGRPLGWIGARGLGLRVLWAALLCAGCAAGTWVDRNVETDGYVPAHTALRLLGHVLLGFAGLALWRTTALGWSRRASVLGLGAAALVLYGLLGLDAARPARLHRILERPYPELYLGGLRGLTDLDRDGYSSLFGGGDCAAFDARVHPGAQEIPNNGRDDNCQLGDLRALGGPPERPQVPTEPSPNSVVLITIDTLRADHLSCYGYDKPTSPRLDAWAAGALRFERAYTTGGWTTLALTSMFRGKYARKLRWTRLVETTRYRLLRAPLEPKLKPKEKARKVFMMPLEDPHPTLPQLLSRRGMHTAAVVDDSYTYVLDRGVGGFRHFNDYVEIDRASSKTRRSSDKATTRTALKMLRKLQKLDKPFLLWVHYFGPHAPSEGHRGVPRFGTGIAADYDHEIAYLDRQLGPLLDKLDAIAQKRPLSVLLTADHGESFSARGRSHGMNLREGGIRIPLLLKGPGLAAGVRRSPASLVDVMPTLLALTRTPAPRELDGVDLLGPGGPSERVLLTDTWRMDDEGELYRDLVGALDGRHKLGFDRLRQDYHLSRQDDPDERDLVDTLDAPQLRAAIAEYLEAHGALIVHD